MLLLFQEKKISSSADRGIETEAPGRDTVMAAALEAISRAEIMESPWVIRLRK